MLRFFLISLALAAAPVDRPKLPPDLDRLVQLANATPPEFAADALLRVAAVTKIEKSLRKELIERAFHLAAGAQFRIPLTGVGQLSDTRSGMIAGAAKLNLDTLSLQTRAVRSMLELDKKAARDLFLEINQPPLERTCDQPLVPDVGSLYDVLGAVANGTFTDLERSKEAHVNLVMSYLSRAVSPVEIAPLERMVASLNVTPEQRDVLSTRLNGLRQSLVAPACPEQKPSGGFWKSEQAKGLFDRGVKLRFKDRGTVYSDAERDTPEWRQQLTDYMKELGDWKPSDEEDEAIYYHQKAIIYDMLVELTPRGPERDKAIAAFVEFVANSNLQRERPAEWFFQAQSLVTRARNSSGEPAKILAAFENSGNPVLVLYSGLEELNLSRT